MLEEERKYEVDPRFGVPDLSGCVPDGGQVVALPPVTLRATYYDTADRRLARAGASLRYRRGDPVPWTVKLPTAVAGIRHEISRPGAPVAIPTELVELVTAYTRGTTLEPAAVLRTTRRVHELRDPGGRLLAELDDDSVAVLDGQKVRFRFREIEVERRDGGRKVLDRVDDVLRTAGANGRGTFVPKHVRALGKLPAPALPTWWSGRCGRTSPNWSPTTRWCGCASRCRAATPRCTRCGWACAGCAPICASSARCWIRCGPAACGPSCTGWPTSSAPPATPRCCAPGCARPPRPTRSPPWTTRRWPGWTPTWPPATRRRSTRWTPRCAPSGTWCCSTISPPRRARPGCSPRAPRHPPGSCCPGWSPNPGVSWPSAPTGSPAPATSTRWLRTMNGTRSASAPSGPGMPPRRWPTSSAVPPPTWPGCWRRCRGCSASTRTPPSRRTRGSPSPAPTPTTTRSRCPP